jgi:feruloyl-CoA synthase
MSKDFVKLKTVIELIQPGLVYVDNIKQFEPALGAISNHKFELVPQRIRSANQNCRPRRCHRAFSAIQPDTIAKFLFTSGSTGQPKAVINTQRMLCSNIQSRLQAWPFLEDEPPVLVDWLPWNHTFGGNYDFGVVLGHGGSLYRRRQARSWND